MPVNALGPVGDAQVGNADARPGAPGQDVDGGASLEVIGDHLAGDLGRIGADVRLGDAVIGREDSDEGRLCFGAEGPLERGELSAEVEEPAQAPRRHGQSLLARGGAGGPALIGGRDGRDRGADHGRHI
jgi:hypothetical protein